MRAGSVARDPIPGRQHGPGDATARVARSPRDPDGSITVILSIPPSGTLIVRAADRRVGVAAKQRAFGRGNAFSAPSPSRSRPIAAGASTARSPAVAPFPRPAAHPQCLLVGDADHDHSRAVGRGEVRRLSAFGFAPRERPTRRPLSRTASCRPPRRSQAPDGALPLRPTRSRRRVASSRSPALAMVASAWALDLPSGADSWASGVSQVSVVA
jgi:hypothetical protein